MQAGETRGLAPLCPCPPPPFPPPLPSPRSPRMHRRHTPPRARAGGARASERARGCWVEGARGREPGRRERERDRARAMSSGPPKRATKRPAMRPPPGAGGAQAGGAQAPPSKPAPAKPRRAGLLSSILGGVERHSEITGKVVKPAEARAGVPATKAGDGGSLGGFGSSLGGFGDSLGGFGGSLSGGGNGAVPAVSVGDAQKVGPPHIHQHPPTPTHPHTRTHDRFVLPRRQQRARARARRWRTASPSRHRCIVMREPSTGAPLCGL